MAVPDEPDHYAVLGVAPTAEPTVIRAAYLALMRQYHPDRNPSPEAAAKAREIVAAFKLLSNFDRRSRYDWDRRRAREAVEGAVVGKARRIGPMPVILTTIAAAAVGAFALMQMPQAPVAPKAPPVAAAVKPPVPASEPTVVAEAVPPPQPAPPPLDELYPEVPMTPAPEPVRVAAVDPLPPRPKAMAPQSQPARVAVAPSRVAPRPAPPPRAERRAQGGTDLATLDQFVMNYYGQSWRYGDAPKRAVLERTRASFDARRGACDGDACKRDATLKLMRDVSSIVGSGRAK